MHCSLQLQYVNKYIAKNDNQHKSVDNDSSMSNLNRLSNQKDIENVSSIVYVDDLKAYDQKGLDDMITMIHKVNEYAGGAHHKHAIYLNPIYLNMVLSSDGSLPLLYQDKFESRSVISSVEAELVALVDHFCDGIGDGVLKRHCDHEYLPRTLLLLWFCTLILISDTRIMRCRRLLRLI